MSTDDWVYWVNVVYAIALVIAVIASIGIWHLNLRPNQISTRSGRHIGTSYAQLAATAVAAFASIALWRLSIITGADASARIAEANSAAKEAQKQTASMTLEIARMKAPRSLDETQLASIKAACVILRLQI